MIRNLSILLTVAAVALAGSILWAQAHHGATCFDDPVQCDVSGNHVVNSQDLSIVAANFGDYRTPTSTATHTATNTPTPTDTPVPPTATNTPDPSCTAPTASPVGAIAGQPAPVFCSLIGTQIDTSSHGTNTWLDDFNHGQSFAHISPAYETYALGGDCRAIHWAHAEHWMVDYVSDGCRGVMMRPAQSFEFVDGVLVVETDVAAGYEPYGGAVWPEIVVSTSPAPTSRLINGLYAYSEFTGFYSVGCRLQSSRRPVCAMYGPEDDAEGPPDRNAEVSFFQHEGATATGGGEWMGGWRACNAGDPDTNCRDRFRWELTKDTWTLYVNGVLYMRHEGLQASAQIPDAFLNSDVYVYLAGWGSHSAETVRFHYDRVAVNP
jgi:hypothetical protein